MNVVIRQVTSTDLPELLSIYAYYVSETAVTFDYEVPSLQAFEKKVQNLQKTYPYLVAESEQGLLGYAYAGPFRQRPAYAWSAEVSIYLAPESRGKGVGRLLYQALEGHLLDMGILNINACIATTTVDDPYLTNASQQFHAKIGFQLVGCFHQSGYKFQRWYDMIWMEKLIAPHPQEVSAIKPFPSISPY